MKYQVAHYSLRGGRPTNQDRTAVAERNDAVIMVVADGLGGHRGGEIASEMLTQTFVQAFRNVRTPNIENPSAFLALTILQAHRVIVAQGKANVPPIEPRTTCVACLVQNGYAYWAHVGDSRLYHLRLGSIIHRTEDHTTLEQLRRDGLVAENEMGLHPSKGHLLKCVGGPNKPSITVGEETLLLKGDELLLCSDGVWEALTHEELARFMSRKAVDEGLEEMLLTAERKMGENCDNISAIGFRWEEARTQTLPVQGNPRLQVDEQSLREGAGRLAAQRAASKDRRGKDASKAARGKSAEKEKPKSLERQIQELEDYISRFEPK